MGCVYFTRHGQTVWNVENKICGATDIELTELGHNQAIELGKFIASSGIKIDEILYSPLIRAAETARHISEEANIPCRIVQENILVGAVVLLCHSAKKRLHTTQLLNQVTAGCCVWME